MQPLLLGHRGARASRHIPENTLASFELCLQHGCDGFEFDVRRSADGVAVICHDPTIAGREVESTPANDLMLPTLDEVLQQFSTRAFLDVELKVAGLETQVVAALREHPPQMGYVISSFLPRVLRAVHDRDGSIPLGLLTEGGRAKGPVPPHGVPFAWVIPRRDLADQELINQTHDDGERVMVWTVNRVNDMRQLAAWGVDAIISDETELLVKSLR